ncbi:FtsX-like permease family protein [Bifidobacterium phasiani]|uniref:FtsX-like permease family protein n=1 Tax=Bifidobacterium phasiani TaxID=2834431 RepID=A0ABS6W8X3_9BIFI|nr:FtsX-like permease family protein [Bifidobacterium phasiani]MBW3082946.1 FtsX-like permease family protein [Bifidobacterium phasiani]
MAAHPHRHVRRRRRARNAFVTMIARSIRGSIGRFLAIIGIVALGCGFFAGLRMSGPDMRIAADRYYDGTALWDIRVISTLGFSDDDVERIRGIDGVEAAMPSISTDVMMALGDDEQAAVRVALLPDGAPDGERTDDVTVASDDDDYLNRLLLRDGRWPEAADECVISADAAGDAVAIGDTVSVLYGTDALDDTLAVREFTVVGTVSSSNYPYTVSFGSTTLGSGMIDQYLFAPRAAFVEDAAYTEVYATVAGAEDHQSGSEAYQAAVDEVAGRIEDAADELAQARLADVRAQAQAELDERTATFEQERDDAQARLDDARQQLDDAAAQIADGQRQLADGQAQAQAGASQLAEQRASADRQLADAQARIDESTARIDLQEAQLDATAAQAEQARQTVADGTAALLSQLAEQGIEADDPDGALAAIDDATAAIDRTLPQLETGIAQAESGIAALNEAIAQLQPAVDDADAQLPALRQAIDDLLALRDQLEQQGQTLPDDQARRLEELQVQEARIDALNAQLQEAQDGLRSATEQRDRLVAQRDGLDASRATLQQARERTATLIDAADAVARYDAGRTAIADARRQVADAQAQLDDNRATADARIAAAQAQLDAAAATLEQSRQELAAAQAQYDAGLDEYERQSQDATAQLADAQARLDDARQAIDELEAPRIYVLDRTQSEGAATYQGDSERMDSIAEVFPFLFFLVAALVALTTMTRMVEDERVEIGTYKALGYGTAQIACKYLAYAAAASLTGAAIGIAVLSQILPYIVMQAYGIIYAVPQLPAPLPVLPGSALLAGGAGVGVTLLCTWFAVVSSLRETPAMLMVPRPPKAGKRILLERVGPLWRRMSFSWKVTCRNIFRYKKRFFMTVVGISGCTALMLVGFGLHNAIWDIIDNQYGPIQRYDTIVSMDANASDDDVAAVRRVLEDAGASDLTRVQIENMQASGAGDDALAVQVVVPQDADELADVITFRERVGHEPVAFGDDAVLVTEKAANRLGLHVGDTVTLRRQDGMGNATGGGVGATVTGIVEYYVGNVVYVGPGVWADMAAADDGPDAQPRYATTFAVAPGGQGERDGLADELRGLDHVSTVAFSETTIETYRTMLSSINLIVVVLIVSAAALAFIVLVNLTNINIGERVREIATLKVLGFTRGEVNAYIFREVAILSLVGDLLGLLLGTWLEGFVITTVEVDLVMFGRSIHPTSYLYAFVLTMAFTGLVVLFMRGKLDRVDMVESLKSVD